MKKLLAGISVLVVCLITLASPTGKPTRLLWYANSPVEGVTNYVVYVDTTKSLTPTNWVKLADVSPSSTFTINGTNYITYLFQATDPVNKFARFVVTSQNEGGESDYSPVASTRADAPYILQVK